MKILEVFKNRTVLGITCIAVSFVICFVVSPLLSNTGNKTVNVVRATQEIKSGDEKIYASEIYGLICSCLVYKLRDKESFNVGKVYKEFENTVIKGLKEI